MNCCGLLLGGRGEFVVAAVFRPRVFHVILGIHLLSAQIVLDGSERPAL